MELKTEDCATNRLRTEITFDGIIFRTESSLDTHPRDFETRFGDRYVPADVTTIVLSIFRNEDKSIFIRSALSKGRLSSFSSSLSGYLRAERKLRIEWHSDFEDVRLQIGQRVSRQQRKDKDTRMQEREVERECHRYTQLRRYDLVRGGGIIPAIKHLITKNRTNTFLNWSRNQRFNEITHEAPKFIATSLTGLPGTHGCPSRTKGGIPVVGISWWTGEKVDKGLAGQGRKKKTEGKNLGAEKYSWKHHTPVASRT